MKDLVQQKNYSFKKSIKKIGVKDMDFYVKNIELITENRMKWNRMEKRRESFGMCSHLEGGNQGEATIFKM